MSLSLLYRSIDAALRAIAMIGSVAMVALITITLYDILTRYTGLPKFDGLNSTMVQESEYWAHTVLFSTVMAYGLTRQAHVRIDLVRDMMPRRLKYFFEIAGILVFLLPFSLISAIYTYGYVYTSWRDHEVSPSTIGLTNVWIVKSMILLMFVTLFFAGLSQLLKCIDGLRGNFDAAEEAKILGEGH